MHIKLKLACKFLEPVVECLIGSDALYLSQKQSKKFAFVDYI